MTNAVWISFDLGVQGDYEGLYTWRDGHQAKDCGDSLAFINYEHSGDLLRALSTDLKRSVTLGKRTRVYVIYREPKTAKMKGKFIFGGRKAPAWSGYALREVAADEVES